MQRPNRRRFLFCAAGGLGAAALGGAPLGGDPQWPIVTRTTKALGTDVSIVARHPSPQRAEEAMEVVFTRLAFLEHLLSIYRPTSAISRLNREGELRQPFRDVVTILRHAQEMSQRSGGAFDVTVQPLWEAFASAAKESRLPEPAAVAAARTKVDWTQLEVCDDRVRVLRPGMKITLNGIAQGYAADSLLHTLRTFGVEHALINAGEHAPLGQSAAGDDWTVGIQHPRHADAYVALADLGNRCLATSGDYATAFSADRRYNHIFDPRSGYSPTELASVSVLAPTAMQADALSTALFVLGPDQGLELVHRTPNTDAFFVLKDGGTIATAGFPLVEEGRAA